MLWIVLGASGSGKSTVARYLRAVNPSFAVLDWDDFMPSVEMMVERDVRSSPDLWEPYAELVQAVVRSLPNVPTVLFTVCTPDELVGWPEANWVLLDCSDDERERRLAERAGDVSEAFTDASANRRLGMPHLDTSAKTVERVVAELVELLT